MPHFVISLFLTPPIFLLFLAWVLIHLKVSILSFFFVKPKVSIDLNEVKSSTTICKLLNQKGLLSDEDYRFETNLVASSYDQNVFRGYLFLVSPLVFIMNKSRFLDRSVLFFVNRWVKIHKKTLTAKNENVWRIEFFIKHVAVFIAERIGVLIHLIRKI